MNEYHFRTAGNLSVCFRTANEARVDRDAILQFGAYVPGFEVVSDAAENPDLIIDLVNGAQNGFENQGGHIVLSTPQTGKIPADVYHLMYGAVRKKLMEEQGLYTIHGACTGLCGDFRLIVGHSGSGKTTLAERFVETHHITSFPTGEKIYMSLFSGNKTVLRFEDDGRITAVAGTRTMTALDDDGKRFAYQFAHDQYTQQAEVNISGIDIIRVNDGVEECEDLSPLSALHTLYPYVMDQVNADVIVGGTQIFDGSISVAAKQRLIGGLSSALENVPVRKVSGDMEYMEWQVGRSFGLDH